MCNRVIYSAAHRPYWIMATAGFAKLSGSESYVPSVSRGRTWRPGLRCSSGGRPNWRTDGRWNGRATGQASSRAARRTGSRTGDRSYGGADGPPGRQAAGQQDRREAGRVGQPNGTAAIRQADEQPNGRTTGWLNGWGAEVRDGRPGSRRAERPDSRADGRDGRTAERTGGRPGGRAARKQRNETDRQPKGGTARRRSGRAGDQAAEQPGSRGTGRTGSRRAERRHGRMAERRGGRTAGWADDGDGRARGLTRRERERAREGRKVCVRVDRQEVEWRGKETSTTQPRFTCGGCVGAKAPQTVTHCDLTLPRLLLSLLFPSIRLYIALRPPA